jgi:hypothetical protein
MFVPLVEKVAVVLGEFELPKVAVPGPLTFVHVIERVLLLGSPSSETIPARSATAGSRIV